MADDLDEATAEVEKLGGRWLEPGKTRQLGGFRWCCMADPEGNEFDIDVLAAGATASLRLGSPLGQVDQSGPEPQPGAALA